VRRYCSPQAAIAEPGQWDFTGSLNTERSRHTATLLSNGTVLAAGGTSNSENDLASSELYDSVSGAWAVTGHLRIGRNGHTATLLPSGMVLVAGGEAVGAALASAELYDPASGSWRPTGGLNKPRHWHTATLLSDGSVLVAGGPPQAELYDPATESGDSPAASTSRAFSTPRLYWPMGGCW
jgi:hypothetical protein